MSVKNVQNAQVSHSDRRQQWSTSKILDQDACTCPLLYAKRNTAHRITTVVGNTVNVLQHHST